MSDPRSDDRELVADYQAGSESAAQEIFDRYCGQLLRLAKRRIGQRLASRFDPEDVIQSAFRTFFVHLKNDEFEFAHEDDLFKLLVRLTVRKTLRKIEHHRAAKRNPNAEVVPTDDGSDPFSRIAGQSPTPDMEVALIDEFEQFLATLSPFERQVLERKVQGYSSTEIAEQLGTYDRKVRRVIERLENLSAEAEVGSNA
jgi:RNA polymerase sigma-70 factor (ECF subfamily)